MDREIIRPVITTQVMIGIKTICLIVKSQTAGDDMPRDDGRHGMNHLHTISPTFDAIAIGGMILCAGLVTIKKSPAVVYCHRLLSPYQIESIIAVIPGTTSLKDIASASSLRMPAKTIRVTATTIFRKTIIIIICVTIQNQIVRTIHQV